MVESVLANQRVIASARMVLPIDDEKFACDLPAKTETSMSMFSLSGNPIGNGDVVEVTSRKKKEQSLC